MEAVVGRGGPCLWVSNGIVGPAAHSCSVREERGDCECWGTPRMPESRAAAMEGETRKNGELHALGVLAIPRHAHGLSILSDLSDNNLATDRSSLTNANADMIGSTESRQRPAEDVKSWYKYRGEGFVLRVPPGYEDVLDDENDEDDDDLYGKRAKDKPFAARFASPDRDEALSIVIKPVSRLRLSFFETKDITDFGSIKEAAPNFVPPGAKLVSARIINSKASRIPRTYYTYDSW